MSVARTLRSGLGVCLWWRRLREQWSLLVTLGAALLVAAVALAAVPRSFEDASERDVRRTIADATPEQRNLELRFDGRIQPGADPLERVDARVDTTDDSFPESIRPIVTDQLFVVDTPKFVVTSFPERTTGPFPTSFRFRLQEDVLDEVRVVRGALPELRDPIPDLVGTECPAGPEAIEGFEPDDEIDCRLVEIPLFETVISDATATDLGVDVGDRVTLTPDLVDVDWQRAGVAGLRLVLEVAGIVELSDQDREFWYADNRLHVPRITENADYRIIDATGLLLADQYRALLDAVPRVGLEYAWRLLVDPERVEVGEVDTIAVELANLDVPPFEVTTGLPALVDRFREQRTTVLVLLSTVAFGVAVVTVAVTAALAALFARRDRGARTLAMARGASRRHLVVDGLRTAALIVVPAAAGWLLAWVWFPSTSSGAATRAVGAMVLVVATTVVVSFVPRLAAAERRLRRVVAEVAIVVATVGVILAVRRRGAAAGDGVAEFDPLLAAAPSLIAVVAALLVARAVGPIARGVSWAAERRRDLPVFVGLRQLVARPAGSRTATAVMLICMATAVFAAALHGSIAEARTAASWYDVGADVTVAARLQGTPLPSEVTALRLDAPSARRATVNGATIRIGRDSSRVDVIGVDAAGYERVLVGAPIRRPPLGLLTSDGARGTPTAIVSVAWPRGRDPAVGDQLTIDAGTGPITVEVAGRVETFPAVDPGRPFVLVDISALDPSIADRPTALHVRGGEAEADAITDALGSDAPLVSIDRRAASLGRLSDDPLSAGTLQLLRLVVLLAAVFAAIAAVAAVAISVAARASENAVLRTLGTDVRRLGTITAVEQVPTLVLASLGGVLAGSFAFRVLEPAIGLSRYAGPGRPVDPRLDLSATLGAAGVVALATAAALAVSMLAQRRADVAATLRVGDTP